MIPGQGGHHCRVVPRRPQQIPSLGFQKQIQQQLGHQSDKQNQDQRGIGRDPFRQRLGKIILEQGIVSEKRHVGLARNAQVHRIQGGHGDNAAEQVPHLALHMDQPGNQSRASPCGNGRQQGEARVYAVDREDGGNRRPQREGGVHRQVGEIQNAIGNQQTQGQYTIDQALLQYGHQHCSITLSLVWWRIQAGTRTQGEADDSAPPVAKLPAYSALSASTKMARA